MKAYPFSPTLEDGKVYKLYTETGEAGKTGKYMAGFWTLKSGQLIRVDSQRLASPRDGSVESLQPTGQLLLIGGIQEAA